MKKPDKIKLILPSPEMRNRARDFVEGFLRNGENRIHGSGGIHAYDGFDEWFNSLNAVEVPEGRLPSDTYFAIRVSDGAIVGIANIRHYIDEKRYHNGHVGYSVHPRERRKGYGKEILRLALIKAEQLGIIEAAVTCDRDNAASRRVIEANGLRFLREHTEENGNVILIYTVNT